MDFRQTWNMSLLNDSHTEEADLWFILSHDKNTEMLFYCIKFLGRNAFSLSNRNSQLQLDGGLGKR